MADIHSAAKDKLKHIGTMPNGSYPINSAHQAKAAFDLRNNSKTYSAGEILAHIKSRVGSLKIPMPGGS